MMKIDWNPPARQLAQFGWISLIGFPLIGVMTWWQAGAPEWLLWSLVGLGVLTCGLSRIDPKLIRPIYVVMMAIALPIGFVISFVMMTLIYYGMVTPLGLLFRLLGKDPLAKHPDPDMASYWHVRRAPRAPADYLKLY